jgi:hypothetical protein
VEICADGSSGVVDDVPIDIRSIPYPFGTIYRYILPAARRSYFRHCCSAVVCVEPVKSRAVPGARQVY